MRFRFASLALAPIVTLALLSLCVFSTVAPRALMAQTNTTGLSGTITDPTGAVVPQAAVELSNPATGYIKVVKSAAKGEYSFEQLAPGKYTVTISATGFAPQTEQVELLIATPLKINYKLTIGNTEVVDVAAGLETINATDATLGKAFDSAQVQSLPFLANNINTLLSLQPGVLATDPNAGNGEYRTGIVNGARQDQSNLTLDGVDNNDPNNGYAFTGILRSTRDSVQEFRVTTTNANADAGRSSGAQVSVATRSGTNQIHGSGYEFYRGPATAANNWFIKQTQLIGGKPNISQKVLINTYGASLGAPIIKDKLFFFGAYEGYKVASDAAVTETVPSILNPVAGGTVNVNGATVGGLVTGNVVYPLAAGGYQVLSQANIASIDQQCTMCTTPGTSAAAVAYFNQFPGANSTSGGDGYNTGSYTFSSPQPNHQITTVAKLDYNINSHQSVFFRGTLQQDNSATTLQFPSTPQAPAVPGANVFGNNKGLALGHIWSVNDHFTNNLRYGFTRQGNASNGSGAHPYVSFSSFSPLTSTTKSTYYIVVTNNFVDDATYVKGNHTIQFGVNDRLITNSRYSNSTLYPTASISASLLATAAIAGTGVDLDPTAQYGAVAKTFISSYNNDILANVGGITSATSYTNFVIQGNALVPAPALTVPTHLYKAFEQEYYVSDQWKATSRLTLTAGVRYTHLGVPYEENGQQVAPNINLGSTFLNARQSAAASGGSYQTRISVVPGGQANGAPNLWTPQSLNFAPRVAFAYAPDNKTSIRGGFAIAYDHFGEAVIDAYDSGGAFALSRNNGFGYATTAGTPRFTGYQNVNIALGTVTATTQNFPILPSDTSITAFGSSFKSDINSNLKTPYAETFNLSIQHEIPHGPTITASYVGRLGRHVLDNLDVAAPTNIYDAGSGQTYFQAATAFAKLVDAGTNISAIPNSGYFQDIFPNATYTQKKSTSTIAAGTYTGAQAYYASFAVDRATGNETNTLYNFDTTTGFNPKGIEQFFYPQYTSIYVQSSVGTSNYNGLQLSARQTFRHGNEYDVNYTYSKSLDYGSNPERAGGNSIINTFYPQQNYAVSDFDARHNVTANYNLGLPVGRGQHFFSNPGPIADRLISGWQINGTAHYSTGFPWSANDSGNYGTNFDNSSFAVQIAPLATGGHRFNQSGATQYETAFKSATNAQGTAAFRYAYPGDIGQRNNLRADGYLDFDDGLSKSFKTYHEQAFKLSVEVFNVFNNVRFSSPSSSVASTKFGNYTGSLLNSPRQMQFSGKYTF